MAFKKIRDLDNFDGTTPFNTGDYLAIGDADGNTTRKATVKDVIETYNVQRAEEQANDPSSSGPELVEDSSGNLVSADPITAANIEAFVDPSSGLEVVEECSPGTDSNGNPTTVCAKKLKLATSAEATKLIFYVWPQRAVCTKYTGAVRTNDVVTSSTVDTEDLYRNNTATIDLGTIPTDFVLFEPGVSRRTSDQNWGKNTADVRAHPRFSLSGAVTESTNKVSLVPDLGLTNDWDFGTTFADFGTDPRMYTDGYAHSPEPAVDINGNDIPFPSAVSSTSQRRDYNELKYGINTGATNHWLYQIEFASNPYNKILTSDAIANNEVYYLDDQDKTPGAVDYYFASVSEIMFWVYANFPGTKPSQNNIAIILKEDCMERAFSGIFFGSSFAAASDIIIHGSENQEASSLNYTTSNVTMTVNGDQPNNTNAPRPNGAFQRTRRTILMSPQRFGADGNSPGGVTMRNGGYRTFTEFFNFTGFNRVNLNRLRLVLDRPSRNFDFLANRASEQASYAFRFSGTDQTWVKDTDIIVSGGSIFTAIECENNANLYLFQGGQLTTAGGQETPNHNLYTKVGYGGNVIPEGILFSQETNIGSSSFDAEKVVPPFALQFILRHKAYCGQMFYLQNSFVKLQSYNSNYMRDAKAGFNPKGVIDATVSGVSGYEAMATRVHIATDALGGALGRLIKSVSSTVEFNAPITTDRQGFVHWGYQEMAGLQAVPSQTSTSGQAYWDLFRFQKFNYGLVEGSGFTTNYHGQNAVRPVASPGVFLYPHSNQVKKSFLDSCLFTNGTSTIDHYNPANTTNYLAPESFASFISSAEKNFYQSPYDNIGIMYPIMAHGGAETRKVGELVSVWDSGNGGTPTTPILRRFFVSQDTSTSETWPPNNLTKYTEVTGDYTLPGKFVKQQGILYNVKTGDYRIVPALIDLVIGIDEFLIFADKFKKDFVLDSQLESIEVSEDTSFGKLSANSSIPSNVFISATVNEAAPLKQHPEDATARSMFKVGYSI